jgi:hypothetical protein
MSSKSVVVLWSVQPGMLLMLSFFSFRIGLVAAAMD